MPKVADKLAPALRRLKVVARATPEAGEGTFEALVSSYGETYEIGWFWKERILADCFAESIETHNGIFPVCWMHAWELGPIGDSIVKEMDAGLLANGELYLDLDPLVARLYRAMKAQAVTEWSIAFYPEEITWTDEEPEVDQIVKGDLIEITSCFRGANPGTETIDLRGATVALAGGEEAARREVVRLRSLSGRADFGSIDPVPVPVPAPAEDPGGGEPPPALDADGSKKDSAAPLARTLKSLRSLGRKADRARRASTKKPDGAPASLRSLKRRVAAGEDVDPGELAQALDAVIDEIDEALEAGDLEGASDLVTAADSTADDLLEALGVADDDELEDDEPEDDEGTEASMDSATAAQLLSSRVGRELLARVASGPPPS